MLRADSQSQNIKPIIEAPSESHKPTVEEARSLRVSEARGSQAASPEEKAGRAQPRKCSPRESSDTNSSPVHACEVSAIQKELNAKVERCRAIFAMLRSVGFRSSTEGCQATMRPWRMA